MKQKVKGRDNQVAGGDIDNRMSVDLRIDNRGAVVDQRVSIGTLFAGPVHIHLVVDRQALHDELAHCRDDAYFKREAGATTA